jgi:hypothetical protein
MADVHGPIDFLILEYPPGAAGDATADALGDLLERGVICLYDLLVLERGADGGAARRIELEAGSADAPGGLARLAGARSGLLGDEDVAEAAKALEPGSSALVLVYENRWAVPFVAAARAEGVEVVASARLTAQEIMAALEAAEAQD